MCNLLITWDFTVSIFKSRVLIAAKVAPFAFALSDLTAFLII